VAAVYVFAILFWAKMFVPPSAASFGVASPVSTVRFFTAHNSIRFDGLTTSISVGLLATWSAPLALLCALLAFAAWERLDSFARWLAVSMLVTVVGRALFFPI